MEFQTVLENRRSVRSYDDSKKVTKEQINEIVEAAIQAPSWKNSQTARYYFVSSMRTRAEISHRNACFTETIKK